jgi:hypothetical protein
VSARNVLEFVLLKYFSGTENVTPETAGELERLQANSLIDSFAHELAAEIRRDEAEHCAYEGPDGHAMFHHVLDLIDPEASS